MTPADKAVTRRSYSRYRGREIVVTINPTWLSFRLAGTRTSFLLDIEAGYQLACKLEAARARAEKLKQKAEIKRGKNSY